MEQLCKLRMNGWVLGDLLDEFHNQVRLRAVDDFLFANGPEYLRTIAMRSVFFFVGVGESFLA